MSHPKRVPQQCAHCDARWTTNDPLDPEWHRPGCPQEVKS